MLFVAVAMLPSFGLHVAGALAAGVPVLLLGIAAFLALGVIGRHLADTPESVAAVANCLMVPMAFLSGSFIPLELMPAWLQAVSCACRCATSTTASPAP